MKPLFKAHVALFLVALIYGANYTIAKVVMDEGYLQPFAFILLRVVGGALLFSLFHQAFIRERVSRADLPLLVLCGLFGIAANQLFFFSGLKLTTPINASLIMTTTPILVLLSSSLLIGERITLNKILGIALGASGAVLLISYGRQVSFDSDGRLGDFLVFLNASCFGIYLVLVKTLMKKYHPITVVRWIFVFGLIFVVPFGAPQLPAVVWASFTPGVWLSITYVIICTTVLAYFFNAYALSVVNPSVVSIYIYLQPVLATLIALLSGSDRLDLAKITSAILIFAGVYLVGRSAPSRKHRTSTYK